MWQVQMATTALPAMGRNRPSPLDRINVKYTNQLADANGNFSLEASECCQIWFEHVANLQQEWP
jgi:hypothetical protein